MVATFSAASPPVFSIAFFAAVLVGKAGMPGLFSITQNLVIPSLRGSATAPQQLTSNILGRALGVVLIGVIADQPHDLHMTLLVPECRNAARGDLRILRDHKHAARRGRDGARDVVAVCRIKDRNVRSMSRNGRSRS